MGTPVLDNPDAAVAKESFAGLSRTAGGLGSTRSHAASATNGTTTRTERIRHLRGPMARGPQCFTAPQCACLFLPHRPTNRERASDHRVCCHAATLVIGPPQMAACHLYRALPGAARFSAHMAE